jgi:Zn-dependent peptidase ImmA (M78 family)
MTQEYIMAEDDADQVLATLGVYSPPVPVKIIGDIFKGVTFDIVAFSDEYIGFSFPKYGVWHILIKDSLPLTAKRFTAFHELYHMLHSKPGYCRSTTEGSFEESKANYFASCILMPARWVRKYWEQTYSVNSLAEIFNVSTAVTEIRLKGLEHYLSANPKN